MIDPVLSRRLFLLASGAAAGSALLPAGRAAAAADRSVIAEAAFIYGAPLVLTGRYVEIAAETGTPFNQFIQSPDLATPRTRALGAQVDTLYGRAWIDLSGGPQVIQVPDTADRYYSIQLMDAYQNTFAYIGRRVSGTKAGAFALVPPGFKGTLPPSIRRIDAPSVTVLALARTLVRGDADLQAARAIHGAYTLGPLGRFPEARIPALFRAEALNVFPVIDLATFGAEFFDRLNRLLATYGPAPGDGGVLASFAAVDVGPGRVIPPDAAPRALLARAVTSGLARIKQANFRTMVGDWSTNFGTKNIITEPLRRAQTNLYGPGTQVAQEALYFSAARGSDGEPLSGTKRYRLRFPKGRTPPVDAFWSVGVYTKDSYLYDNPIDRYSITDRTPGLTSDADGALTLLIQHERPTEGGANWLPTPADAFNITVRTYQPRPEVLNRRYELPPLIVA